MSNFFNGIMGPVAPGMCRMTPNGRIGIKTNNGYKTFDVKTGRLTNCANFVFDIGEEMFFVIPTNHLKVGDIVLVNGTPRCVIKVEQNEITALNYENSTKEIIIPEHHIFYGKAYMYGKIVSPMSNFMKGNNMMKYMMMSSMMKHFGGNNNTYNNNANNPFAAMMSNPMGLMMMSGMFGGKDDIFEGMFDFDELDMPELEADTKEENTEE